MNTIGGAAIPGARFVHPAVLARIGNLELLARTVVDGFINGQHRAPYFGGSVDFAEHRGYVPGDDVRRVDWRLYARSDRYYVKQYEAETNANFTVLFDLSRSMAFGSRGVSKVEYSCYLAACLAYLAHRQRDRVGIATFDADVLEYVPPSAKHLNTLLYTLDRARAERRGGLRAPLMKLAERLKARGIVALVSDLYEEPDAVLDVVLPLRALGHDVIVFHVLDAAEIDFPYDQPSAFQDLETGEQLPIVPESFADRYRALVQGHIDQLREKLTGSRIDYVLVNTAEPLDATLFAYLSSRDRLMHAR